MNSPFPSPYHVPGEPARKAPRNVPNIILRQIMKLTKTKAVIVLAFDNELIEDNCDSTRGFHITAVNVADLPHALEHALDAIDGRIPGTMNKAAYSDCEGAGCVDPLCPSCNKKRGV